jgi:integrase
VTHTRND